MDAGIALTGLSGPVRFRGIDRWVPSGGK